MSFPRCLAGGIASVWPGKVGHAQSESCSSISAPGVILAVSAARRRAVAARGELSVMDMVTVLTVESFDFLPSLLTGRGVLAVVKDHADMSEHSPPKMTDVPNCPNAKKSRRRPALTA